MYEIVSPQIIELERLSLHKTKMVYAQIKAMALLS